MCGMAAAASWLVVELRLPALSGKERSDLLRQVVYSAVAESGFAQCIGILYCLQCSVDIWAVFDHTFVSFGCILGRTCDVKLWSTSFPHDVPFLILEFLA
jgi:hypothetical protein